MTFEKLFTAAILATVMVIPCHSSTVEEEPKRTVIAGKVDNYDPQEPIEFIVNRIGVKQEKVPLTVDGLGNFHGSFMTYIPADGWMTTHTNFLILLNPGDSIYVSFDGSHRDRPELLSTVQFSGHNADANRYAAQFQQKYYSDPVYSDWNTKARTIKSYGTDEYLIYADMVRQRLAAIYDKWAQEVRPDERTGQWARAMNDEHYYSMIGLYPGEHRASNGLGWADSTDMQYGYFAKLDERLPIAGEDLHASYAMMNFTRDYRKRIMERMWEDRSEEENSEVFTWIVLPWGGMISSSDVTDSLNINGILKYAQGDLLKQIMLTKYFDAGFEMQSVEAFEKCRDIVDEHITFPFLREPLLEHYAEVKARLEAPKLYSDAVLKEAAGSEVKEIFDEILQSNKGKVIYIDFWATWCGPCLGEFPYSKAVEQEFQGQDVAFVYVCLESQRELALATLARYQLGGSHYILSLQQSRTMRDLFNIDGIPFYLLIDKEGTIIGSGSHLRPRSAKGEIIKLIR